MCATTAPVADPKAYASEEDAADAMNATLDVTDEQFRDNYRFAFLDDPAAVAAYEEAERAGCCGSYDADIIVAGRPAWIGCNYGH
jgi:hypothetical protein